MYRVVYYNDLYILMSEFTMSYTMQELFEAGHEAGVPIVPVNDVEGFAKSPHTRARGFFIDMDHPEAGSFQYPGPPYRLSETPFSMRRPAPCLGEHNETIYCDELGFSKDELTALKRAKVV
jgi:crotonobetainyl-CoA:carnitine CoA-transferase CaiB-like acyl-CoA transferase